MNKMISVASGFQYSVNIGYDLNNVDKLRNFIPTKSAISLMTEILASTSPTSTDRARVLIGAYGKGKSHIVLTILSLLLKKDLDLFEKLMPKIEADPRLSQLVQNYYESENMILPVVITGSSTSLTQAFTLSLQRTLSEFGLIDAMPETNYKAAIAVIERWEKDFPETFAKFSEQIDEPVSMFTEKLASYDSSAYETFERIYPSLTAGSVFNPFLGFDVVELYESVAKSLKPKGYTGIYVIYDEFSKFLEANITTASVSDTKMLQDFAEKCTRSGKLQLHLMLISHKEISNYIDKLPQQKVDGWRGVSERFRHIHMNNNFSQTYEIISSVIQHHEPEWSKFISKKANEFGILLSRYGKHQMFADATSELNTAIYGCYPLHPVSTFILPRLSERVAQNERTLFTFLSAEGAATLPSFIEKSETAEFSLITPDLIYDYFEPLFKKEAYAGDIHSIGLRVGLIPIYLAAMLHEYRQQTVITDRFGPVATSADALVQINADPASYYLEYLDWNPEKENYTRRLAEAYRDFVVEAEKANNSYDYVANAMHRWYMALPKFSKESTTHPDGEKITKRQVNMIKLLRQNVGGSELMFKKIPDHFDQRREVVLLLRRTVMDISNQRGIEQSFRFHPEIITAFAFTLGIGN